MLADYLPSADRWERNTSGPAQYSVAQKDAPAQCKHCAKIASKAANDECPESHQCVHSTTLRAPEKNLAHPTFLASRKACASIESSAAQFRGSDSRQQLHGRPDQAQRSSGSRATFDMSIHAVLGCSRLRLRPTLTGTGKKQQRRVDSIANAACSKDPLV